MTTYNFFTLLFAFNSLFVGLLIFLKRQDKIGKIFFAYLLLMSLWGMNYSIAVSPNISDEAALTAMRITCAVAMFIPVMYYHFALAYTRDAKSCTRIFLKIQYGISGVILLFSFSDWFIPYVRPSRPFPHYPFPGPLFYVFTFMFWFVLPFAFFQLYRKIKISKGEEKNHLRGLIIASFFGYFGGCLTFFPVFEIYVPQYGIYLMPIYPYAIGYFMIHKRLLNEEDIIKASHRDKLAAIGTLTASINHEIRNPLYVIQGTAESHLLNMEENRFADNEQALAKTKEILKKTVEQTQRAMAIMKQFSQFAKQSGAGQSALQEITVRQVMSNVLPLVSHELELDKIELKVEVPENLPKIKADPRHLEEVFFNLIINAAQAIKPTGKPGKITIKAESNSGKVIITIEDNGPGISKDGLKTIFEPFYTTKDHGTGLGLYITRQLVERNNGTIEVKSDITNGTRFSLRFTV